jgi:hypothetical protein
MSELTKEIRTAGYWEVAIHPASFREKRIPSLLDLEPMLQKCVVAVRGWDFPHIDRQARVIPRLDFIEQESDWEQFRERWRFYQSGLFVILRAMHYDWRDRSSWHPRDAGWKRGATLGIGEALYALFEVFELAARLSNTPAGDDRMRVAITAGGLQGRMLVVDDPRRFGFPRAEHVAAIESFPLDLQYSRAELLANPAELAVAAARELFARFNWDIPVERLTAWLATLRKRD